MPLNNFDHTLSWVEFKDIPAPKEDKGDGATIGVGWDTDHTPARNQAAIYVAKLTVNITMDPNMCTVSSTKKTTDLLKHEQGHYDIMALAAREFYNRALKLTAPSDTELNDKIDELFKEVRDKSELTDDRYDLATNHSKDKIAQQTWNQKIDIAKKNPKGTVNDLP